MKLLYSRYVSFTATHVKPVSIKPQILLWFTPFWNNSIQHKINSQPYRLNIPNHVHKHTETEGMVLSTKGFQTKEKIFPSHWTNTQQTEIEKSKGIVPHFPKEKSMVVKGTQDFFSIRKIWTLLDIYRIFKNTGKRRRKKVRRLLSHRTDSIYFCAKWKQLLVTFSRLTLR